MDEAWKRTMFEDGREYRALTVADVIVSLVSQGPVCPGRGTGDHLCSDTCAAARSPDTALWLISICRGSDHVVLRAAEDAVPICGAVTARVTALLQVGKFFEEERVRREAALRRARRAR